MILNRAGGHALLTRVGVVISGMLCLTPGVVFGQQLQTSDPIFLTAKTAECIAEVEGPKSERPSFSEEIGHILRAVDGTKLWSHYRHASASKADIIIKITENLSQTITFRVFSPDDNKQ